MARVIAVHFPPEKFHIDEGLAEKADPFVSRKVPMPGKDARRGLALNEGPTTLRGLQVPWTYVHVSLDHGGQLLIIPPKRTMEVVAFENARAASSRGDGDT